MGLDIYPQLYQIANLIEGYQNRKVQMTNKCGIELLKSLQSGLKEMGDKGTLFTTFQVLWDFSYKLMDEYCLQVGETKLELLEIEYYLFDANFHKDPYIHMSPWQNLCGYIYVHERGANRGGVDLTFGDGRTLYGGILLKSVRLYDNGKCFIGQTAVRECLSKLVGCKENEPYESLQATLAAADIKLMKYSKGGKNKNEYSIVYSKRIGLKIKEYKSCENCEPTGEIVEMETDYKKYAMVPYRFVRKDFLEGECCGNSCGKVKGCITDLLLLHQIIDGCKGEIAKRKRASFQTISDRYKVLREEGFPICRCGNKRSLK